MSRLASSAALLACLTSILLPAQAQGQHRPGIERGDYWGEVRALYRSEVLAEVGEVMEQWLEAWNNDDVEAVQSTFAEDGVLILGETMATGREQVGETLAAALPPAGPLQYGLQDFDVSGDMAFATTLFRYAVNLETGERKEVSGHLVWILVKHTGAWQIRSQVFRPIAD